MEYDAVIVGAGIIGLATAYHIKKQRPDDHILLIDKFNAAGQGNTAKSAAMFRCFFSSNTNLTLVNSTVEFFKHVQSLPTVDLKLTYVGYLWLLSKEQYSAITPVLASMAQKNLEYSVFEGSELAERLNLRIAVTGDEEARMMGLRDVDKGILIPKAGSIDIDRLVQFYETEIRRMHVEIRYNIEAETVIAEPEESLGMPSEPLFWQESGVTGVSTSTGKIRAKKTIIAAGVWTNSLLTKVGIYSPMEPLKRQLFSVRASTPELKQLLHTKGFNNRDSLPFTILPNPKVYMKPALEEEAFWLSYGDHFPRAYQLEEDPQPEENFYRYGIYQVASKYLPQFVGAHPSSSWAGQYALNTIDGQPVIFEQNNLIVVGSCSGSGNMKCDAIGRIAAALYAGEEYTQLPGSERFKTSDLGLKNRNAEPEKLII